MQLETRTLRKSINKAFLKETVDRSSFNHFKTELGQLLKAIEVSKKKEELEEHYKKPLISFLEEVGFKNYNINTSDRIDLAIHTGPKGKDPVGVLFEVKSPTKKQDMVTKTSFNRKALHQAVLYYLVQRLEVENTDLKHVIVTDMLNWFVFDAQEFERCFYKPSALRKVYKSWKEDQKVSSNKDFMYEEIAKFIDEQDSTIRGLHLYLAEYSQLLEAREGSDHEKKLIPLYKFFSPIHLLKESFANDSNTLNREFYRELLYILGLEETKDGSTRYIERATEENRQAGSMIENTIRILDTENHLSTVREPEVRYGKNKDDQLFNVALELGITWMNRILFLKLLEAQLYRYHREDNHFKFLEYQTIDEFDELNKLFFQVLARKEDERTEDINEKFGHIPYLNSSLFDPTALEHQSVFISNLDDKKTIPVYSRSVLTGKRGDELNTLQYLFAFLEAYDFAAEGGEEIQQERKTLINASVLGLIFEKINGYKDGSFFTPGFITEYMARETLRKAVTDKFAEHWDEEELTFTDIYNRIGRKQANIEKANEIVDSITICDPAVGSGHFLVSCLNELLAIKSDLGILCGREGKLFHHVNIEIENDELIVTWGDEELFEYEVSPTWQGTSLAKRKIASDRQRIQKALFHEKRHIIENCLFGVDINPNSVKICRLRLWIELLKNTYYTERSNYRELEVLPNIDINIKTGNSLVSRFELDSDLSSVFKNSDHSLEDYKGAVRNYKHTGDREEKQRLQKLIDDIKEEYSTTLLNNRPINKKLSKQRGRLEVMQNSDLFGDKKFTQKEIKKQKKKVRKLEEQKAEEESGVFYNQAFEWRFEFPEVLDTGGGFTGFDVVIGNPPYIRQEQLKDLKEYFKTNYEVYQGTADLYSYFIEQGMRLLHQGGLFHYIVSNKWMRANYGKPLREWMQQFQIESIIDFGDLPVFEEATTYPCLLQLRKNDHHYDFKAVEVENLEFDDLELLIKGSFFDVDQSMLVADGWTLINKRAQTLLEKVKNQGVQLAEYVDGNIYRGVLTGLNKAFVINNQTKEELISEDLSSKELIKPFLAGKNIKRYQPPSSDSYLILIPSGWTDKQTSSENKWEWFESNYPAIAKHLSPYEERARKRYDQGKYWWELRPCDYYEEFAKPKILFPDISKEGDFTFDKEGTYYMVNTAYFIPKDDLYLLALLGSNLIEFYYRGILASYRGGYLRFFTQYLEMIPIVNAEDDEREKIESLISQILTAKKDNSDTDISELESKIDRLVYDLYGLDEDEIAIVEESVG
ncbi:Eco57I restriction-modification methylase domain-containing protein [Aliifodinibius sp. S!AR15-10]|uniref:type IIG restriction enzyme/methyltransferase n=1 Tax=Aliifodinibius sp. S!AR15-10 TaxID=2950437 RepID=UPI0028650DCD|nr:TaqI-like C-terminal specificity domain-containing protein [Aliifodinibius sp. S!AR15-10]MDR8389941.1 Eco57I restriction-modification methylase domain-containing protein [Aliifodinibius sp. S!AR15-10]